MFTFVKNEVTGLLQCNFPAKLIQIGSVLLNTNTDKKTPYRVGTIEFNDAQGKTQRVTTLIWDKNYQHGMQIGNTYLSTATHTPGRTGGDVLITTSHLEGSGVRADSSMFGFEKAVVKAPASPVVLQEDLAGIK